MKGHVWAAAIGIAVAALATGPASAQNYPTKPVRLIVAYPPGGGADGSARIVAQKMSELLGQQIIIDNRPGAGANIGAAEGARAAPDGYTLVQVVAGHAIGRSIYKNLTYDYLKDFAPIGLIGSTPFVVSVPRSLPVNSVKELIAYAKERTGDKQLSFSSSGVGSSSHLAVELFKVSTGTQMVHVPYKGSGPSTTDLIAGRVQLSFLNLPAGLPLIKSGEVKGLAVTSAKRSELAPDLPTLAELGVRDYEASAWFGLAAPAATPKPIIGRLAEALAASLKDPATRKKLLAAGIDVVETTPESFGTYMKAEAEKWAKIVEISGARPE